MVLLLAAGVALPARACAMTITCLGDSITAGYGLDEDQAYPALIEAMARADHRGWTVINAGVSGDTTAGALSRMAWILKAKPDAVLIAIGGNDGLRGLPIAQSRRNLEAIVDGCRVAHATPLLAGMLLPTNYGEDYRTAFAAMYPAAASARAVPLLPFLLAGVGGNPHLNQVDGIHPTAEGQRIVAQTVYAFLVANLAALTARLRRRRIGGRWRGRAWRRQRRAPASAGPPPAAPPTTAPARAAMSPGTHAADASGDVLRVEDLGKTYRQGADVLAVLEAVAFAARAGESVAITGPSGSGKSTLLGLVAGLDTPTRGRVVVAGQDLALLGASALAAFRGARMGFVFQSYRLLPTLSALENVALPLDLARASDARARARGAGRGLPGRARGSPARAALGRRAAAGGGGARGGARARADPRRRADGQPRFAHRRPDRGPAVRPGGAPPRHPRAGDPRGCACQPLRARHPPPGRTDGVVSALALAAALAWRLARGQRRRLLLVVACMAVGAAAWTAVAALADTVADGVALDARALLGGDLEVASNQPLSAQRAQELARLLPAGSTSTRQVILMTMARDERTGRAHLVELHAVEPAVHPLGGSCRIVDAAGREVGAAALVSPEPGLALPSAGLELLGARVGDRLRIGSLELPIVGTLVADPGLGANPFVPGPRVLAPMEAVTRAGLSGAGARVRYSVLVRLADPAQAVAVAKRLRAAWGLTGAASQGFGGRVEAEGVQVRTAQESQQVLERTIDALGDYLSLVALLALLIGGVGVASVMRASLDERRDAIALLQILGASVPLVQAAAALQALALGALGGAVGAVAGLAAAVVGAGACWGRR